MKIYCRINDKPGSFVEYQNVIFDDIYTFVYLEDHIKYNLSDNDFIEEIENIPNDIVLVGFDNSYNDILITFKNHYVSNITLINFSNIKTFSIGMENNMSIKNVRMLNCNISYLEFLMAGNDKVISDCSIKLRNTLIRDIRFESFLNLKKDETYYLKNNNLERLITIGN